MLPSGSVTSARTCPLPWAGWLKPSRVSTLLPHAARGALSHELPLGEPLPGGSRDGRRSDLPPSALPTPTAVVSPLMTGLQLAGPASVGGGDRPQRKGRSAAAAGVLDLPHPVGSPAA